MKSSLRRVFGKQTGATSGVVCTFLLISGYTKFSIFRNFNKVRNLLDTLAKLEQTDIVVEGAVIDILLMNSNIDNVNSLCEFTSAVEEPCSENQWCVHQTL